MNPLTALGLDFFILLVEACVFFALCWLVAKKIDNWSIVDVAWSYGFALVGLQMIAVHFFYAPISGQGLLMAAATVAWSVRLGSHLAKRVLGHLDQEDGRYLKMRAEHGDRMPAQMATFYFIQALVLAILCLPLLSSNPTGASGPAQTIHWVGLGVVCLALLIETLADAINARQGCLFAQVLIAADDVPRVLPPRDGVHLKNRFRAALGFETF
jgi:steroid 5-alpha reductase family enzyme